MGKRCFDLVVAAGTLLVVWPVLLAAAVGIRISDPGPVLYRARRVGRHGVPFCMYKLRTMRCRATPGSAITGRNDARIFPLGRLLRAVKIDELPQLINVLRGEMSIVGPRPEAEDIVTRWYSEADRETLAVRPGFTSPGVLFAAGEGETLIGPDDPEGDYVRHVLPQKMALDRAYLAHPGLVQDLHILLRTAAHLLRRLTTTKRRVPHG